MKKSNAQPRVYVSRNGGRMKISNKTKVFLKDKDEFDLELTNPTSDILLAKIELNGNLISSSGLVIKPGQKYVLKRYIDENRKFIFNTYHVDSNDEDIVKAISSNGKIKVTFYKEEQVRTIYCGPCVWINNENHSYYGGDIYRTPNNYNTNLSNVVSNFHDLKIDNTFTTTFNNANVSLETGRVEKGNITNQSFEHIDINFEKTISYTEELTIYPSSLEVKSKETLNSVFCHKCGKKCKSKDSFCSDCGTPLYK